MFHDWMGGMWFSWIFWIIIVAVIILLVVVVIQTNGNKQNTLPQEASALDILKKRYARGEINKTKFEEKKKDLS